MQNWINSSLPTIYSNFTLVIKKENKNSIEAMIHPLFADARLEIKGNHLQSSFILFSVNLVVLTQQEVP